MTSFQFARPAFETHEFLRQYESYTESEVEFNTKKNELRQLYETYQSEITADQEKLSAKL